MHKMNIQTGIPTVSDKADTFQEEHLPVFQQPWWLDAVCGEQGWKACTLLESDNAAPLVWPVYRKKFGPFQYLSLPLFTQKISWEWNPAADYRYTGFLEQNPRAVMHRLALPDTPGNQKLLEQWGFEWQKAFSYQAPQPADPDEAWKRISPTARAIIKKAAVSLTVRLDNNADTLYQLVAKSHRRHGIGPGLNAVTCARMVQACVARNQGGIFRAEDATGQIHAAALLVWDRQWIYYLLAGMDENITQVGGSRLLIWHTMQLAFAKNLSYDFHGGMSPSIGSVYASMGGRPSHYLRATRYRPAFLKQFISTAKRFYAPNDHLFH